MVFTASIRDHVLHLDIKFNTLQFKLESIEALLDGIDQSLHKLDEVIDSKTDESELCLPLNSVSSDNAPVILFAPVEGNLNDYKHLVTAIGEERSVWGVLSPHAVAAVDDFYSIEEMAAQQIRSVAKKIDPTSTLVLVGWSMGGILATEFARFWTGSVRLVLLDSNPYPPKLENNPYSLDRLMRLCHTMKIDTKALIDARVDYAQGKQSLENIHSVALKLKLIDERIQLEALDGQLQLIHKNFVSASRYSPGLYSEEVLMLRATQTLETSDEGSILHQEGFVSLYPQCNWVEVDSNHFEMVNEKHASKIADQIKQYISNI
ncbi:MAG: hypothetical protein D6160_13950 [Ketobacter sp.]|nr:MAG: hypothetical protein D6160_13950 [Ketobacter sp.]